MKLAECGDTLTVKQLCAVLQITERSYYRWQRHAAFPIPRLPFPGDARYSKTAVQAFLDGRHGLASVGLGNQRHRFGGR